ncbi:MAG: hypothetical protein VKP62_09275 [Candidatus Sericytochromatia bacterium]|nr:hypothetical protein [Candidatus Sericytochromatia bacterium]
MSEHADDEMNPPGPDLLAGLSAEQRLAAMRDAIAAGERAARARANAKRQRAQDPLDREAAHVIEATVQAPPELPAELLPLEPPGPAPHAFELGSPEDLANLIAELDRVLPDSPVDEVHGDLVIKRSDERYQAWYELAAQDALPAALREIKGPIDVKRLLTALLVEVGDVKRTNAMLLEHLARIEEKLDRNNRMLRQPRGW